MDTTRNRSLVLAQFLRAAVKNAREAVNEENCFVAHNWITEKFDNALASIEAVAEELEEVFRTSRPPST